MLRDALATLPADLDQTYERVVCNISKEDSKYAIRMLRWLARAVRPLSMDELAGVIAIDHDREPAFVPREVLEDPMDILNIGSGLITLSANTTSGEISVDPQRLQKFLLPGKARQELEREERLVISVAQFSVQEYLMSDRIRQRLASQYSLEDTSSHASITRSCLMYFNETRQLNRSSGDDPNECALDEYGKVLGPSHSESWKSSGGCCQLGDRLAFDQELYLLRLA